VPTLLSTGGVDAAKAHGNRASRDTAEADSADLHCVGNGHYQDDDAVTPNDQGCASADGFSAARGFDVDVVEELDRTKWQPAHDDV